MNSNKVIIKTKHPKLEKSSYYFQEIDMYEVSAEIARIYFETDSSALNENDKEVLDWVSNIFNFIGDSHFVQIGCQGYTDQRGSFEYNQRLAKNRSNAVANYLRFKNNSKNIKILPFTGFMRKGLNYSKYRFVSVFINYIHEYYEMNEKQKEFIKKVIKEAEEGMMEVIYRISKNPKFTSELVKKYMKYYRIHDLVGLDENLIFNAEQQIAQYLIFEIEDYLKLMKEFPNNEKYIVNLSKKVHIAELMGIEDTIIERAYKVILRAREHKQAEL